MAKADPNRTLEQVDVAIVGGGLVGMACGLILAERLTDARIVLLEGSEVPRASHVPPFSWTSRTTALSARSLAIFERLGLWPELEKHSAPIRNVHVSDRGHIGFTSYSESDNQDAILGAVVENPVLAHFLVKALSNFRGLSLLAPNTVDKLQANAAGYAITLEGGEQLQANLAILADGAHSIQRQALGIDVDVYNYQQHAIVATLEMSEPHRGQAFERFTRDGPLAFLPLGVGDEANTISLVWTTPESKIQERMAWSDGQFIAACQAVFGHRLGSIKNVGPRNSFPLQRVIAKEQIRNHLVLMGNAAHFLHPVAGQGFNLALRDAEVLAQTLAPFWASQRDEFGELPQLEAYLEKQDSDQAITIGLSHGLNRLFTLRGAASALLRNIGLLSLNLMPSIKTTFFEQMMGTGSLTQVANRRGEQ